ncbi:MAG: arginine N-succinyltransferase [Sphingomicrobium sp.]
MTHRIRAARPSDLEALHGFAELTGGGFTNLPADRDTLSAKLERARQAFERSDDTPSDDLYVFILEDFATGAMRGTCQVFGSVGLDRPFYSYLIATLTQKSEALGKVFRNQSLNLTTDLEGSSEVGGLFLHPEARMGGLGLLLSRCRYLFLRTHRERFADTVLAELRGIIDEDGHSPFWDAIGGRFFGMTFPEADDFNAVHGTQFIADLFPKSPIYTAMLPDDAQAVIGQPHPSGKGALRMLEAEGFVWDSYVDIFDGGPTVIAATDKIRTVRDSKALRLSDRDAEGGSAALLSAGRLGSFKACYGQVEELDDDEVAVDAEARAMLEAAPGDTILIAAR